MAAGVEIKHHIGQKLQPCQVLLHGISGEGAQILLRGTGVHGIGCMGKQCAEAVLRMKGIIFFDILQIKCLHRAASGVSGEKLEHIRPKLHCLLPHGKIALGGG